MFAKSNGNIFQLLFLIGNLLFQASLPADPCVDRLNFTVNLGQLYAESKLEPADVGVLAALPVANINDPEYAHIGDPGSGSTRLGDGSFHVAFLLQNGAWPDSLNGKVYLRAKGIVQDAMQTQPAYNGVYNRSLALGLLSAKELEAEQPGSTSKVRQWIVDDRGRIIGRIEDHAGENFADLSLPDKEKLIAEMLPPLALFWNRSLNSGSITHPAHGDLHPGNIYRRLKSDGSYQWVLSDMGPPPWFSPPELDLNHYSPKYDRIKFYVRVMTGSGTLSDEELIKLFNEVPDYLQWTKVLADVANLQVTEFHDPGAQPLVAYNSTNAAGKVQLRSRLVRILNDMSDKIPDEIGISRSIIEDIKNDLFSGNGTVIEFALVRLGGFANVVNPGAANFKLVMYRNPR